MDHTQGGAPATTIQCSFCGRRLTLPAPLAQAISAVEIEGWTRQRVRGGVLWRCPRHPASEAGILMKGDDETGEQQDQQNKSNECEGQVT